VIWAGVIRLIFPSSIAFRAFSFCSGVSEPQQAKSKTTSTNTTQFFENLIMEQN
jgi:hypothetical protein